MRKKLAIFTAAVGFLTLCNVLLYTRRLKPDDETSAAVASGSGSGSWRWTNHERRIVTGDWNLTYDPAPVTTTSSTELLILPVATSTTSSPRPTTVTSSFPFAPANMATTLANRTYTVNGTTLSVWIPTTPSGRPSKVTFNLALLMDDQGAVYAYEFFVNSSMATLSTADSSIDFGANYSGNSSVDVTDATTVVAAAATAGNSSANSSTVTRLSVLNEHPFSLMINVEDLCVGGTNLTLLILVTTAVSHAAHRQAIRDTWGSVVRQQPDVRLAFVMGKPQHPTLDEQQIVREALVHGDVLQEDFVDTYKNLTLKTLMLLKWTQTYCSGVKYVMKTDDDMFINMPNLLKYLRTTSTPNHGRPQRGLLLGRLVRGAKPIRTVSSKYYVPNAVYPDRVYPDYLSGTAYVMSVDVAARLYVTSRTTPFFFFEDVYVTGICAKKARIVRRNHGGFVFYKRPVTGCAHARSISGHNNSPNDIRKIWNELQRKDLKC